MPLYEYECQSCGEHVERIQRVDDSPLTECPKCGGPLRRLLGVPALQFKGSGWYVTDYGGGNGRGEAAPTETGSKKEGTASETVETPKKAASATTPSGTGSQSE